MFKKSEQNFVAIVWYVTTVESISSISFPLDYNIQGVKFYLKSSFKKYVSISNAE